MKSYAKLIGKTLAVLGCLVAVTALNVALAVYLTPLLAMPLGVWVCVRGGEHIGGIVMN
jgi:hypothetical protein